jgi:hypothetical protein
MSDDPKTPCDDGTAGRDDGMARAEEGAGAAWMRAAAAAIARVARQKAEFVSEEVWTVGGLEMPPSGERRALGPAMKRAWKDGLIEPTERFVPSPRSSCHRAASRVWRSLVHGGPGLAKTEASFRPIPRVGRKDGVR